MKSRKSSITRKLLGMEDAVMADIESARGQISCSDSICRDR